MIFYPDKSVRVRYNHHGHAAPAYLSEEHCHEDPDYRTGRDRDPRNVRGREDPRQKEVRVQPNNSVSRNAVTRSPTQINSYCRFDRGETDPDRRIVLQLHRDCRDWELDDAE